MADARPDDAMVCKRLVDRALMYCEAITVVLRSEDSAVGTSLAIAVSGCKVALVGALQPYVMSLFLQDPAFQNWALVMYELLYMLRWKLDSSNQIGTLRLELCGPRLRQFYERADRRITRHTALLRPALKALDIDMLEVRQSSGEAAYAAQVRGLLRAGGALLHVEHLIEDEDGRAWWLESFGQSTYAVPWEEFGAALAQHSDGRVRAAQADDMELIQATLSAQNRRAVSAYEFGEFLHSFGPTLRVALIQMQASLRNAPWFAGALSFDEARSVLSPCPPGTFLVRFSESSVCTWAVSYCDRATGGVSHALVTATSGPGRHDSFSCGARSYRSLEKLISANAMMLKFPARGVRNLGPARCFRDQLSFEDAAAMLEGKPPGTFLLRFSQTQPASLVVAYNTADRGTLQSKIYCDSARGGFVLGGQLYPHIADLVRQNSDRLAHPLAVDKDLTSVTEDEADRAANQNRCAPPPPEHNYGALSEGGLASDPPPPPLLGAEATYLPVPMGAVGDHGRDDDDTGDHGGHGGHAHLGQARPLQPLDTYGPLPGDAFVDGAPPLAADAPDYGAYRPLPF